MAQSINTKEQDLARVKNNLQMPLIVRDLMITGLSPENDAIYALHDIMSNMQPDDALLCAAFTIEEIANAEGIISTEISFLQTECARIIERYTKTSGRTGNQKDKMHTLVEDIEDFLDITSLCNMSFEITNQKAANLLDIIMTQLQAHLVIADEVVSMLEAQEEKGIFIPPAHAISGMEAANIIMFPG